MLYLNMLIYIIHAISVLLIINVYESIAMATTLYVTATHCFM